MNLIRPLFSILPHSSNSLWGPRFWALELHIKHSPASSSVTHEVLSPPRIEIILLEAGPRVELNAIQALRKMQELNAIFEPWRNIKLWSRFGGTEVQLRIQSGKLYLCNSPKRLLLTYYFKTFYFICLAQIAKCSLVSQDRLQTACAR